MRKSRALVTKETSKSVNLFHPKIIIFITYVSIYFRFYIMVVFNGLTMTGFNPFLSQLPPQISG